MHEYICNIGFFILDNPASVPQARGGEFLTYKKKAATKISLTRGSSDTIEAAVNSGRTTKHCSQAAKDKVLSVIKKEVY